jgi:aspartyl/glutamyl-tRNA(Asn/Gln) amidotransferase C subunit
MTKINIDQLAKLAQLEISPEEHDKLATDVGEILEYLSKIQTVKSVMIKQIDNIEAVVRPDEVEFFANSSQLRQNFSKWEEDLLSVPPFNSNNSDYDI